MFRVSQAGIRAKGFLKKFTTFSKPSSDYAEGMTLGILLGNEQAKRLVRFVPKCSEFLQK